jgi:putative endonuclease
MSRFANELSAFSWPVRCLAIRMRGIGKRFVYVLQNDSTPSRHYTGITSHPDERLEWHNAGVNGHTSRNGPWSPLVVVEFPTEEAALRFERYLKSGSGRAFAKRHFGSVLSGPGAA